MSDYHPLLDGPAEPIGLAMDPHAAAGITSIRVLNLGAGVQSTALLIMAQLNADALAAGAEMPYPRVGLVDFAVFADTGDEPWKVYLHLVWLAQRCSSIPILVRSIHKRRNRILSRLFTRGGMVNPDYAKRILAKLRLIENGTLRGSLKTGLNSTGQRFASIPAYTWDGKTVRMTRRGDHVPNEGKTRRQCTAEWKIDCVERTIRRDVCGLGFRQRIPRNVHVTQIFGLSYDEPARVRKTMARFQTIPWATASCPLFVMEQTRGGCLTWLKKYGPPYKVARSACTHCPLRANPEWVEMRDEDPESWLEACDVDDALRTTGAVANRDMTQAMYLHRSCLPLREAPIEETQTRKLQEEFGFANACEGLCGT